MTKEFEIGQVVYVLAEKEQIILPGIVVEEVVVKKITGNSVSWKIKVGAGDRAKLYDTSRIAGEVYGDLDELRVAMMNNFSNFLNDICKEADAKVEKWYGKEIAEQQKARAGNLDSMDKIDPDSMLSSISESDSSSSSSSLSTLGQSTKPSFAASNKDELRRKLENAVRGEEGGFDRSSTSVPTSIPVSENGKMFIMNANGERIEIRQ